MKKTISKPLVSSAQGIAKTDILPSQISDFLDDIEKNRIELHGFVILQHGNTIADGWWHPYRSDVRHQLFSLSKSFTSTAAGFAVSEGILSLDDHVISFFPDKVPKDANDNLRAMKIRHLLSMSTGHESEPEIGDAKDWVKAFLSSPPTREPGTHFLYNSIATYMVSAIIQKITGQTVRDYLMPRLFSPLGIPEPEWDSCPKGINAGGWGLWLTTGEIARFGQFLLNKGAWEGKQLLPQEWVVTATSIHIDNSSQTNPDWKVGYGFQFWRCRHGFYRGDGAFGQYCIVMEEYDAVIAITSGVADMQAVLDLVWKRLVPDRMTDSIKITMNPDEEGNLTERSRMLHYAPPVLSVTPEEAVMFFGRWKGSRWNISENPFMIKSISFKAIGRRMFFEIEDERGNHRISFGWGKWVESVSTFKRHNHRKRRKFLNFASANWMAPSCLQLTCRFPETPDWYEIVITQTSETNLEMKLTTNVSFGPVNALAANGKLVDA
jgi:CubicO group peptidase (beta-lactamase class C family)